MALAEVADVAGRAAVLRTYAGIRPRPADFPEIPSLVYRAKGVASPPPVLVVTDPGTAAERLLLDADGYGLRFRYTPKEASGDRLGVSILGGMFNLIEYAQNSPCQYLRGWDITSIEGQLFPMTVGNSLKIYAKSYLYDECREISHRSDRDTEIAFTVSESATKTWDSQEFEEFVIQIDNKTSGNIYFSRRVRFVEMLGVVTANSNYRGNELLGSYSWMDASYAELPETVR